MKRLYIYTLNLGILTKKYLTGKTMLKLWLCLASVLIGYNSSAQVHVGVKAAYSTLDISELYYNIESSIQSNSSHLLRQCDWGLLCRVGLGGRLYVQPEITVASKELLNVTTNQTNTTYNQYQQVTNNIQTLAINVPVLIGWNIAQWGRQNLRLFVGPEFYSSVQKITSINNTVEEQHRKFNFETYSLLGGFGLDIIEHITIDLRVKLTTASLPNQTNTFLGLNLGEPLFYTLSVGLML